MMLPKPSRNQTIDFSFSASGADWVHQRGAGGSNGFRVRAELWWYFGKFGVPPQPGKWFWGPNSLNCVPPYIKVGFGAAINVVDWPNLGGGQPETVGTEIFKQFVLGEIERKCFISIITPQWEFGDTIWSGEERGKNLGKKVNYMSSISCKN